jgi:Tfp pilus assembly protein FimT
VVCHSGGEVKNKNGGFSVIEILLVTVVMGFMTMFGFAQYQKFNDRQKIQQAADDLVTHLRFIQKRVASGDKGKCTGTYTGYTLARSTGGGTPKATLSINCPSISETDRIMSSYAPINGTSLAGNTLSTTNPQEKNQPIIFKPLGQGINGSVNKVVKLTLSICEIEVTVTPGGTVTVGDVTGC